MVSVVEEREDMKLCKNGFKSWRIPKGMRIRKIKSADWILPRLIRYDVPTVNPSDYDVLEFKKEAGIEKYAQARGRK
jgi:hypothetical protein